jgi:biotin carboxyl carrier protein
MARYEVTIDGRTYEVEILLDDGHRAVVKVDDREYEVDVRNVSAPGPVAISSPPTPTATDPGTVMPRPTHTPTASPKPTTPGGAAGGMQIRAPMPGLVLEVIVSVGQRVKPGDVLLRVEAMKMENDIKSDAEGTVKEILVSKGDEVLEGAVLVVLEE